MSGARHKNNCGGRITASRWGTMAVIIICAALSACSKSDQASGQPPASMALPVTAIEVEPTSVPSVRKRLPRPKAPRRLIRPRVGGILLKRLYEEGAEVKEGQPLFLIDPVPYQNALAQAKAQLAEQEIRVGQTEREENRLRDLLETQSISQREYDNSVSKTPSRVQPCNRPKCACATRSQFVLYPRCGPRQRHFRALPVFRGRAGGG